MKYSLFVLVISTAFGFGASTFAQSDSMLPDSSSSIAPITPDANVEVLGSAKMEGSYYTSSLPNNTKLNQSLLATVGMQIQNKTGDVRYKVDATLGKYIDWGSSFFSVQELYSSYLMNDNKVQVSAGRKIEFWSQADKDWQLGLWEPQYNLDDLRPTNQGLTGFFYKQDVGNFHFLAFGTPVFIPTMGPAVQEQDGALVSDSRWYQTPSSSSLIMNHNTQLIYSLDIPDISNLVLNPGAGFRAKLGGAQGAWASVNWAHKPINSLLLRYDAHLYAPTSTGQVVVGPVVGYHSIWGGDLGYNTENGRVSISYLQDAPENQLPVNDQYSDWVQQQPGAMKMYAIHSDTKVHLFSMLDPVVLAMDYLRVFEVPTVDLDSTGGDRGSLFPYRLNYTNAFSIKGSFTSSLKGKKIITDIKYLRDFDQNGTVIEVATNWFLNRQWVVNGGIDVLAVDDSSDNNLDPRFINQFRANDRVYGGFNYVF